MFIKILFVISVTLTVGSNAGDTNTFSVIPEQSTPSSSESTGGYGTSSSSSEEKLTKSTINPNDKDHERPILIGQHLDNDEFVQYQNERHDEFDWKLAKSVLLQENKNIMLSSFSIKLLLSLLAEASGNGTSTHKELSSVLHSIQSIAGARDLYGQIFTSLQKKSDDYDLNLATKIYVDDFIEPTQRFAAIINAFYHTTIDRIDFSETIQAANIINAWCSNITNNNINDLIHPDDLDKAVIVMLSGIYFNGYWRRPFPLNETFDSPFYVTPTQHVRTTYMTQTAKFYYGESTQLDAKILRLPYKGKKFSMVIVLPNSKGGINELIRQIESTTLHRALWLMDEVEVRVVLPKFKFDHTQHFNHILESLGITQIFSTQASLASLAHGAYVENRLVVSQVLQKAGIDVNERGSTVYAATEVILTNKFGGDDTPEFIANRPFLFLIEDETTGTLLFSGKVVHPTYEG